MRTLIRVARWSCRNSSVIVHYGPPWSQGGVVLSSTRCRGVVRHGTVIRNESFPSPFLSLPLLNYFIYSMIVPYLRSQGVAVSSTYCKGVNRKRKLLYTTAVFPSSVSWLYFDIFPTCFLSVVLRRCRGVRQKRNCFALLVFPSSDSCPSFHHCIHSLFLPRLSRGVSRRCCRQNEVTGRAGQGRVWRRPSQTCLQAAAATLPTARMDGHTYHTTVCLSKTQLPRNTNSQVFRKVSRVFCQFSKE